MGRANSVLVLGAGIQGISVALALRRRGYHVRVIDQMPALMLRTSLRSEGKIHLGFVYANDSSFQTSALMLRAALHFAPLFDDWLEMPVDWRRMSSAPFVYLIARDSMLAPDALYAHYHRLQDFLNEMIAGGEAANYLGNSLRDKKLWQPAARVKTNLFSPNAIAECFETAEVALERTRFRALLRTRLAAFPEITIHYATRVETIERAANGFHVRGTRADGTRWHDDAEIVINCLWDGRLALDAQLGLRPQRAFVMRLKYRVLGELPATLRALPSLTMVLGRYGDVVRYQNAPTYFSWYPACLRGWSQTLTPPSEWDAVCAGNPPPEIADAVARETMTAFEKIIPAIGATRVKSVDGGIIYAWGESDINDFDSELHKRYEIGFTHHDGYYSVDTGKFTTAPLLAQQLVRHLDG